MIPWCQTVERTYDLRGRLIERDEPEGLTLWSTDTGAKGICKLAPE